MINLIVPDTINPMPLKNYLRKNVGLSLTLWRKIKHNGTVLINGQLMPCHTLVQARDIIAITWIDECTIKPEFLPLDICFEDDYLIILNKPAGMLVHPTTQQDSATLANGVIFHYQQNHLNYGFHPVHRLDRNTSGLMVIAKLPHIQHLLNRNNIKPIKRWYLAVTSGFFNQVEGSIDAPIGRNPSSIIERMVRPDGKPAITHYRVIKNFPQASLVELELITGRTHQIRVHLSYINHPLLGDDLYGGSTEFISRQALHAARISFNHPITGKNIDISSPLPDDITILLSQL